MFGSGNLARIAFTTHDGITLRTYFPKRQNTQDIYCLYAMNLYDLLHIYIWFSVIWCYSPKAVSRTFTLRHTSRKAVVEEIHFSPINLLSIMFAEDWQQTRSFALTILTHFSQLHQLSFSMSLVNISTSVLVSASSNSLNRSATTCSEFSGSNAYAFDPLSYNSKSLNSSTESLSDSTSLRGAHILKSLSCLVQRNHCYYTEVWRML